MSVVSNTKIGVIDCTPTWEEFVPVLLVVLEEGSPEGKALAIEELKRMALIADIYIASTKVPPQVEFHICDRCKTPSLCRQEKHCDLTHNGYR